MQLSEQEIIRREKLKEFEKLGINPYPAEEFKVTSTSKIIHENFEEGKVVQLAGRIMSVRIMGKAAFAELQDAEGKIQIYVSRDDLKINNSTTELAEGDAYNTVFKKLLDIGDFIGIKGFQFKTKVGEISIHVESFNVLSKTLRPLPIVKVDEDGKVHDAFSDSELRYRMRYVDLVVNPKVKEVFIKRTKMFNAMREYFNSFGYMEVETPVLQAIPGGAAARPFITHHNALRKPRY